VGTKTVSSLVNGAATAIAAAVVFISASPSVLGQQLEPRPDLLSRAPVLAERVVVEANDETAPGVIDFENVQGRQVGAGIELRDQYKKTHGLTFGRGDSVHFCARVFDDVNASLCPYPQAASGKRAAAHDVRSGGPAMVMSFSRPIEAVSMRINPTGGSLDEVFVAELTGFNDGGEQLVQETIRFNWNQDAFAWPITAGFETDAAQVSRVTVVLRRVAQNNQPVRFLIDDLTLVYTPERALSPVAAALDAERAPPKVNAEIVQSPEIGDAQQGLRIYPAATRKRAVIDWDAVDLALEGQAVKGLTAANYKGEKFVEAAELPVLLPSQADAGSPVIVGNRDSYNTYFTVGGRAHSLYGSRLLTVIAPARGATPDQTNLTFMKSDETLIGSFALYGASYSITRQCLNGNVEDDPACHDEGALEDIVAGLVVVVGEAGRRRP
jgi:hypothetical protein